MGVELAGAWLLFLWQLLTFCRYSLQIVVFASGQAVLFKAAEEEGGAGAEGPREAR